MTKRIALAVASAFLAATPLLAYADTFNRQMEVGMAGSDISMLQSFLAGDVTIYPQGLVTGYFGFLTKAAVANFQSRNGLPAVGRVGPATLPVLNMQAAGGLGNGGAATGGTAASILDVSVNQGKTSATVSWHTNESARGVVYYSQNPLTTYDNMTSVTVSGDTASTDSGMRTSQSVSISNLQSNTTYYYLVYTTDQDGNVSVTWPTTFRTTSS